MELLRAFLVLACAVLTEHYVRASRRLSKTLPVSETVNSNHMDYRLPNHIQPIEYHIKIVPFIYNLTFIGDVKILVSVSQPTDQIFLNSRWLKINGVNITVENNETSLNDSTSVAVNYTLIPDKDFLKIQALSDFQEGNYTISIKFAGVIRENEKGLIRTFYHRDGVKRYIIYTQFQAMFARTTFPCFDEPNMKAHFHMNIAHFTNQTASSNMPILSVSQPDSSIENRIWTSFQKTPPMSTYIVDFIISDFDHISNSDSSFNLWARPNAITYAHSAEQRGESTRDYLIELFDHEIVVPKLDIYAIPDFIIGAMENWGLLFYKEHSLLAEPGKAATRVFQFSTALLVHEISHQWFGNLVTPSWWSYLWLNEGFAVFFEYYVPNDREPQWRFMNNFVASVTQIALSISASNVPLTREVRNWQEAESLFDSITYEKGACIINMMRSMVGDRVFFKALRAYIKEHSFNSVTPDDLFKSLQEISDTSPSTRLRKDLSIKTIMDTWTLQDGYPLLTVIRHYENNTLVFTQEPFLIGGRKSMTDNSTWWIPINCASETHLDFEDETVTDWLRADEKNREKVGYRSTDWIICNKLHNGFYRVNYDQRNWEMIIEYLKNSNFRDIHIRNRVQLINDAFSLAQNDYLDYETALSLSTYMINERDLVPWLGFIDHVNFLKSMLKHSSGYENFQRYFRHLLTPLEHDLGYAENFDDDPSMRTLRPKILGLLCTFQSTNCKEKAKQMILDYYRNPNPDKYDVSVDLQTWFLCHGIKQTGFSEWTFLKNRYYATQLASEKDNIVRALRCTNNRTTLFEYLGFLISDESQMWYTDVLPIFHDLLGNSETNSVVLDFIAKNYQAVAKYFKVPVINLLINVASVVRNDEQLQQLQNFIMKYQKQLKPEKLFVDDIISIAENNIKWLNQHEEIILNWLKNELSKKEYMPASGAIKTTASVTFVVVFLSLVISYHPSYL